MSDAETITTENVTAAPAPKKRIWELDFLRGFMILLMVMDHMFMLTAFFFGPEWYVMAAGADNGLTRFYDAALFYCNHNARAIIQPIVAMLFLALCGLSTGFSKNNLKRGCVIGLVSLLITTVTYAIPDDDVFVSFGIINLIACCVLTWSVITAITKNNKYANLLVGLAVGLTIFALFFAAQSNINFKNKMADFCYILIQTDRSFDLSPTDFFPIIPWAGTFFMAAAVSPFLYPDKTSHLKKLDGKWNKPICFVGRHTLLVYAAHIILIFAVLELVSYATFHAWPFMEML